MTMQPVAPPHLLTVAEYLAIGEIEFGYSELAEGRLVMSPSPTADHNRAAFRLGCQLEPQCPPGTEVNFDLDIDLQLAPADAPGTVRQPDMIVVRHDARQRLRREGGVVRASELLLVVEILSPGSRRIDCESKRFEYADAGIQHYWLIEPTEPVSLTACHLAGEFGYQDAGPVTGTFTTAEPFPAVIHLDELI
ncbi:Uma2 family endonuclease [Pseudonocardia sp. TRM90224]|uniref:Uma2 family endonuclease n=1 Tax=Pseudonocardia sp. TRM90224 TaxID=2812678 RepID=UPI001E3C126F|nr:Uma2 family endonuclease [Pseudonocardia sp. TRM90224]